MGIRSEYSERKLIRRKAIVSLRNYVTEENEGEKNQGAERHGRNLGERSENQI